MTSMDKPAQQSFDLEVPGVDEQQDAAQVKEQIADDANIESAAKVQAEVQAEIQEVVHAEKAVEDVEEDADIEVSVSPERDAKSEIEIEPTPESPIEVEAKPQFKNNKNETEVDNAEYIDVSEPIDEPSQTESLSSKETREVVTPYAFTVSPDLLGQPLATPTRRGVAILVDLLLISVLTGISSLILAGFVALTFFKAGNRLKLQKNFNLIRLTLRGSAAVLIFVIVYAIISDVASVDNTPLSESEQAQENEETMRSLLDLASELIEIKCSNDSKCLLEFAEGAAIGAAAMEIPVEDINATASDIISQKEWSDENKSLFMNKFVSTFNEERNAYNVDVLKITKPNMPEQDENTVYSVVEWFKGIMSDLGLGLGWAALYFSVFTAWWRGQTIGKKLLGIEVVKLDGNYPSLWESFGRYGGYGAGFATGLLGFLQIYWDPNRQAIQDKISETLVLRLKPLKSKS